MINKGEVIKVKGWILGRLSNFSLMGGGDNYAPPLAGRVNLAFKLATKTFRSMDRYENINIGEF